MAAIHSHRGKIGMKKLLTYGLVGFTFGIVFGYIFMSTMQAVCNYTKTSGCNE